MIFEFNDPQILFGMFQGFKNTTPYGGTRKLRLTLPPVCCENETNFLPLLSLSGKKEADEELDLDLDELGTAKKNGKKKSAPKKGSSKKKSVEESSTSQSNSGFESGAPMNGNGFDGQMQNQYLNQQPQQYPQYQQYNQQQVRVKILTKKAKICIF